MAGMRERGMDRGDGKRRGRQLGGQTLQAPCVSAVPSKWKSTEMDGGHVWKTTTSGEPTVGDQCNDVHGRQWQASESEAVLGPVSPSRPQAREHRARQGAAGQCRVKVDASAIGNPLTGGLHDPGCQCEVSASGRQFLGFRGPGVFSILYSGGGAGGPMSVAHHQGPQRRSLGELRAGVLCHLAQQATRSTPPKGHRARPQRTAHSTLFEMHLDSLGGHGKKLTKRGRSLPRGPIHHYVTDYQVQTDRQPDVQMYLSDPYTSIRLCKAVIYHTPPPSPLTKQCFILADHSHRRPSSSSFPLSTSPPLLRTVARSWSVLLSGVDSLRSQFHLPRLLSRRVLSPGSILP